MASFPSVRPAQFAPSLQPDRWVTILDAYIIREMWGPFAGGLAAFLLFWFINIFFLAADYVINQHAPIFLVLRFLLFRVPQSTPMAFPFACLLGTLLAFGRLTADNEIMALRTSGVPFMRIARTPVLIGVAMFVLSYLINETVVPIATDMSTRTFYQIIYKTQTLPVEPGLFRKDPSSGRVFYVGSVDLDGKTMHNVMIFEPAHTSQFPEITTADLASVDGAELRMGTAVQTRYKPNGLVDGVVIGHDVVVGLPLGESADSFLSSSNNDPYTMDAKRLSQQIKLMEATGQGGTSLGLLKITLAQKLAYPFASFIAILIALPLAVKFGKKGRALGIALSVVVLFIYYALSATTAAFGRNDVINPYIAAWLPNVIMGGLGSLFIWQEDR